MSEWKKISDIADVRRGASPRPIGDPKYFGGEVGWVRISDVTRSTRFLRHTEQYVSALGESLSVRVDRGDLIMSICGTLGRPIIIDIPACIHDGFVRFSNLQDVDTTYLFYVLQNAESAFNGMGQPGTQTNLNTGLVGGYRILIPGLTQQRRIAEILGTVDEVIEATEALIAKQQQVKAGLMHDLFTRGVTSTGALRPPPAEAPHLYQDSPLGPIPKEWAVESLGALAEIVSGVTLSAKTEVNGGIEVPYLRVANVQDGYLDLSEIKTVRVSLVQLEKLNLRAGDVLMNEGGDFDKLGRGTVWNEEISPCVHQNHVFRVRPHTDHLLSRYLAFWSQSTQGKKYFVVNSKQSTNLASINSTQLHRFPVALPRVDEQREIETRILAQTDITAAETAHLAKLRQEKQGLMQDLLTGRVPVSA